LLKCTFSQGKYFWALCLINTYTQEKERVRVVQSSIGRRNRK